MSSKKIDVSQEGYVKLINEIFRNLEEERNLALDKYRLYDQKMDGPQDYVMMGKPAATFLNLAASRSDALFNMSKEIKALVYTKSEGDTGATGASGTDSERKLLEELVNKSKKDQKDSEQNNDISGDIENKD